MSALLNAKFFSIALFKGYDRKEKRRFGFLRIVPGSIVTIGERLSVSHNAYHGQHARLDYRFDLPSGKIGLTVNWRPGHHSSGFHGEFHFHFGPKLGAPTSVVLPLGLNRAMYSTKALLPFEGELEVFGETHRFKGTGSMGILDDHKGYYPFSLHSDRVVGFGLDAKKRRVGFALAQSHAKDPCRYNENCIWIGNKVWPLPSLRVTRAMGHEGNWVIQDTEGLVDLVFMPEVHNDMAFHYGLFESDYHGPFGTFKGFVKNGEGDTIEAERLFGVGEQRYLRV
jgi:hypothetical protein